MGLKQKVLAAAIAAAGTVSLGTAGAGLIQSSEGLSYAVYLDPIGVPTVCWGHTSPYLRLGMTFTKDECDMLFRADVAEHQSVIVGPRNCLDDVTLTKNEVDALTSLAFNIGNGKFCHSTMALDLRARNFSGAANQFAKWKYAGGRILPGLVIRRAKERDLFLSKTIWVSWDLRKELRTNNLPQAEDHR